MEESCPTCQSYLTVKCGVSVWQSRRLGGHNLFSSLEEQEPRISILAARRVSDRQVSLPRAVCYDIVMT